VGVVVKNSISHRRKCMFFEGGRNTHTAPNIRRFPRSMRGTMEFVAAVLFSRASVVYADSIDEMVLTKSLSYVDALQLFVVITLFVVLIWNCLLRRKLEAGKKELQMELIRKARVERELRESEATIQDRLELLTAPRPDDKLGLLTFQDVFDIARIQKVQNAFAQATGVASIITDPRGIPITRPSNFCRLCSEIIRKTDKGFENCVRSAVALGRNEPGEAVVQPCLGCGLWNGGVRICVGDQHIATWLVGQVKNDKLDEERIKAYVHEIGADENEFRAALDEVPTMSLDQFQKVCNALYELAGQMSRLAFHNLQQARAISERMAAENNLKITLQSIGDAVITTDNEGIITRMNPVAEQLTGWTAVDAVGCPLVEVFNIINTETREREPDPVEYVLRNKQTVALSNHTVLIAKDRSERQIADSAAPIMNNNGDMVGVVLVFRDVTEQYRMREAIRKSEAQLRSILRAAPVGIGLIYDRHFDWVNPEMLKMTGYTQEELIGQSSRILYESDEEFERIGKEIHDQIGREGTGEMNTHWVRKDGRVITVYLRSTPVNGHDLSAGVIFTAMDMSNRNPQ